jgi:sulfur carrier protein ThiS adenylyltransferase
MNIRINEKSVEIAEGSTIAMLRDEFKPGADVLILNGFTAAAGVAVREGDELFLIKRGEIPSREELEFLMSARHTPGVHGKLKQSVVGIAGVGGLGSLVAVELARIGVGRLIVADFDVVEPSNLNRQQYFVDQLGLYKVDALAANLARINPYVIVEPQRIMLDEANIPVIFAGCGVVVEAFDRADMKSMLVDTVLTRMKEAVVVAASGLAGYGPNNDITTQRIMQRLFLVGDQVSEAKPGSGLMAPRVGIAASHQANQVVRIILGETEQV